MRITAIQIAAGLSSRMRGPNKLLQEVGEGKTLVQHTFGELIASFVDEVIVVTGRDTDLVSYELRALSDENSEHRTSLVFNPDFEKGMTTSIQAGLKLAQNADAVMI